MLHRTPIVALNDDARQTLGWPRLARTVSSAYWALPPPDRAHAVILTGNYGQAGALDRYGPELGLPRAYSGHNAYGWWGPPPADSGPVLVVGREEQQLRELFGSVQDVARIDNGLRIDNDEQGRTVWLCRGLRSSWSASWPQLRRLA